MQVLHVSRAGAGVVKFDNDLLTVEGTCYKYFTLTVRSLSGLEPVMCLPVDTPQSDRLKPSTDFSDILLLFSYPVSAGIQQEGLYSLRDSLQAKFLRPWGRT